MNQKETKTIDFNMESARTEKFNYSAPSSPRDKSLDLEKYRIDMYSEGERE